MADSSPTSPYTAVARRYRPQQFADLIGQEHVAQALANAIRAGRVAHAYLFTGGRGMGKTTTARLLAKALNCRTGPTPTPCDVCDSCQAISAGDDVDVVEIDAATNTQVENVRDLKANVGFRPQHGRFKIYIIDEVHMLSTASFNALLKTLEEPPAHVKFILATTEVQKLPATILSRCQRFDFTAVSPAKVFESLKHIARREGVPATDDALQVLARRANGSLRDAQTLLDQTLSAVTGELTADQVQGILGLAADDRVLAIASAILARDTPRTLHALAEATTAGAQPADLLDQLTEFWRGLMLVLIAGPDVPGLPGSATLQEGLRTHAAETSLDTVLAGIDVLTAARGKAALRGAHTQVLLEVAAVRLARLDELVSVAALVQLLRGVPEPPRSAGPALAAGVAPAPEVRRAVAPPEAVKKKSLADPPTPPPIDPIAGDLTPENLPRVWGQVLETLGIMRREQLKFAGIPAILGPNALVVPFPAGYSAAYEVCATDATGEILRNVLRKITGRECQVRVELLPASATPPTPSPAPDRPAPASPRAANLLQLPLFVKAAEVLGAQLLRVDEGFDPHRLVALEEPELTELQLTPDPS